MAGNTDLQIQTLTETYRLLLSEGDITRAQLKAKVLEAQAGMEDGTEITATRVEGGSAEATVMYPKEVVLAAALQVLRETDTNNATRNADQTVTHADLSRTRIET